MNKGNRTGLKSRKGAGVVLPGPVVRWLGAYGFGPSLEAAVRWELTSKRPRSAALHRAQTRPLSRIGLLIDPAKTRLVRAAAYDCWSVEVEGRYFPSRLGGWQGRSWRAAAHMARSGDATRYVEVIVERPTFIAVVADGASPEAVGQVAALTGLPVISWDEIKAGVADLMTPAGPAPALPNAGPTAEGEGSSAALRWPARELALTVAGEPVACLSPCYDGLGVRLVSVVDRAVGSELSRHYRMLTVRFLLREGLAKPDVQWRSSGVELVESVGEGWVLVRFEIKPFGAPQGFLREVRAALGRLVEAGVLHPLAREVDLVPFVRDRGWL